MLIHSPSQILTLQGGPQRGLDLGALSLLENTDVLIREDKIVEVGPSKEMIRAHLDEPVLDVTNCVVLPGLVDPHTHVVWAGDRAAEFEMKMAGAKYMDILAAGGGILSTVNRTRAADLQTLINETRPRLQRMFAHGTTTAEAKSGYGLEIHTELKMLQVILALNLAGPLELLPTFLGAHAIAPEFKGDPQGYTDLLCNEMLPAVKEWWDAHTPLGPERSGVLPSGSSGPERSGVLRHADEGPSQTLTANRQSPFVDVFCETGAFDLAQSRQILLKASELGFPLKVHADEFDNLGGASLAVELGAVSADHLVKTSPADIAALARSDTVAVSLPCTPFGLAENQYTPAHQILEAGGILALATDCNPGTAWCESMQFVIALACRALKLTPAQAIAAATINAAHALRQADRIGSIEPGKQADLLILACPDYRQLGYRFGANLARYVVKRGKIYSVDNSAAVHPVTSMVVPQERTYDN